MSKSLFELHISFLAPEEGTVAIAAENEEEAKIILVATLDTVKELKVVGVKNLGPVPDNTEIDTSESVQNPATDKKTLQ
jgi:hypothetical protein